MQTSLNLNLLPLLAGLATECAGQAVGRVSEVVGLTVKSVGPQLSIGNLAWIETEEAGGVRRVAAEVVGFKDQHVLLMPVEYLSGIRPGARVFPGGSLSVAAGRSMLGRVLDGLGRPIDGGPVPAQTIPVNLDSSAPEAMKRQCLSEVFTTGIRAIDGLMTCAKGQRLGIFSGSGVGKSSLLGSIARHSSARINVIALVGERGREVRDFVENALGPQGLAKSVVVAVTSDQSPMLRIKGAATAMAIAEFFRHQGEDVLLLMDSITRYAMAQREIGLAVGEPPTTKGYPPSVFGLLARLLERAGASDRGSITAFYTILVEADDMNDPIADSVRAILDGHIVLSRDIAAQGLYPPIDVLNSLSRLMTAVAGADHRAHAERLRALLAVYQKAENLINIGAYQKGANPRIDEAVQKIDRIKAFLAQRTAEAVDRDETLRQLEKALA
ncbi:MAG: FliI/YscN family ATPase [Kiritimatiellae bacterium]|nr:FliI/YscN family ATPase [Kiritimatiellia bacterium]